MERQAQTTEVQTRPQGDGDSRPFRLPADVAGPVRVHVEKSGPAFKRGAAFLPMTVAESLGASLVAQTGTAIGEVLSIIQRGAVGQHSELLNLMPAWSRLLRIYGVTPSSQNRIALRRDWFWTELQSATIEALRSAETDQAPIKWQVADMLIRGEAMVREVSSSATLRRWEVEPDGQETADMLRRNIATYRAFTEGRA